MGYEIYTTRAEKSDQEGECIECGYYDQFAGSTLKCFYCLELNNLRYHLWQEGARLKRYDLTRKYGPMFTAHYNFW